MIPAIIVVLPLLLAAFLAIVLYKDPAPIKYIALAASLVSLAIAIYIFFFSLNTYQSFNWFNLSGYSFNLSTSTAPLQAMLLLLVSIITPLIFLYSMGFMELPSEQSRFYSEMCIFAAAMMLFSISASFLTLIIAWELLGITSYLLIGFFYKKDGPPTAARKAITTIIIGDLAMLGAVVLILNAYHSLEYSAILGAGASPSLTLAMALLLVAVLTKSAQFPFHEWLSDAMEGPTPVSAFLHSSTMVKAGVFLVMTLLPLFQLSGLLGVILVIGLVSAAIGATNALTDRHIKKVLAYSTIEDLGLMFVALGLGSLAAAAMLFVVQTFYKALLFMGAGAIMKANDGREDLYSLYNSMSNKLIFIPIVVGVLSIAAFPPLGGFFGKAAVETSALPDLPVYVILLAISLVTSTYAFRWLILSLRGDGVNRTKTELVAYSGMPRSMTTAMVILAALVVLSGAAYLSLPSYLSLPASAIAISPQEALIGFAVSVAGAALAYYVYRLNKRAYLSSTHTALYYLLHNSSMVNGAYGLAISLFMAIAEAVARFDYAFDKATYQTADYFIMLGNVGKGVVNGQVNGYVLAFALGIAVLVVVFLV